MVETSLAPLKKHDVDTLILGCTDYPLIADLIAEVMGEDVQLISSAEEDGAGTENPAGGSETAVSGGDESCPLMIAF